MSRKNKNRPHPQRMRLKPNHTWKAPKGYKIVVMDRGAVSFNVPDTWILTQMEPLELHDVEPPDDNVRLMVSFWRTPPGVDWTGLPLPELLLKSTEDTERQMLEQSEIRPVPRDDLELVWTAHRFLDTDQQREAYSHIALARGWDIHTLLTFDFWVADVQKFHPVWDEVLRSLQLGRRIEDPTKGAVVH